jgi:xylulokinase
VIDTELVTVNTTEGAAYGAALLAGVGAGLWGTVAESCQAVIGILERTQPQPGQVSRYQELYPLYRNLYPALRATFEAVAE